MARPPTARARADGGPALRVRLLALIVIVLTGVSSVASGRPVAATPTAAARTATARTAVAPFVYAADRHTGGVSQFGSSLSGSGALRPLTPKTVASGRTPTATAVSPQGTSVYVVDDFVISQYTINPATGKLTPKSPATVTTGGGPIWITIAPDGTSAYVADYYGDAISQYSISPATGKLTHMSPATAKTPGSPGAIAVAPDGKYAYVADVTKGTADNVLQYRINPRTGALSSRPVARVAGGPSAESVTIAPDGKSAYVTDPIDSTVWQYRISPATGRLSPLSPATVPTGKGTHDLVVAPDGKNAYVVTVLNNTVSQYRINAATGALSRGPASTARTVRAPELIALAPNGKNAYVTGDIGDHLSQYAISPATGKITPLSPATVTTRPGGSIGLAVTPAADLAAKVSAPTNVKHGATLTYTIKVSNEGPSEAWGLALTDHLFSGTAFLKAKNTRGHCSTPKAGTSGGTVRCHLASSRSARPGASRSTSPPRPAAGQSATRRRSPAPPPTRGQATTPPPPTRRSRNNAREVANRPDP